jgi:hypothetical protein
VTQNVLALKIYGMKALKKHVFPFFGCINVSGSQKFAYATVSDQIITKIAVKKNKRLVMPFIGV